MDDLKVIDIQNDQKPEVGTRDGYSSKTGFQSSADDHREHSVDWNEVLKGNSIFWFKVDGFSMKEANILPGDILFYDRKIEPYNGCIVFVTVNYQFTVRYYFRVGTKVILSPANPMFKPIEVTMGDNCFLEGVVTFILYKAQCRKNI
jgi:DNA polymerase V